MVRIHHLRSVIWAAMLAGAVASVSANAALMSHAATGRGLSVMTEMDDELSVTLALDEETLPDTSALIVESNLGADTGSESVPDVAEPVDPEEMPLASVAEEPAPTPAGSAFAEEEEPEESDVPIIESLAENVEENPEPTPAGSIAAWGDDEEEPEETEEPATLIDETPEVEIAEDSPEPTPARSTVTWDEDDEEDADEDETDEPVMLLNEVSEFDDADDAPEPTPAGSTVSWDDGDEIDEVDEETEEPAISVTETPEVDEGDETPEPTPATSTVVWNEDEPEDVEEETEEPVIAVTETPDADVDTIEESPEPTPAGSSGTWDDDESEDIEVESEDPLLPTDDTPEFEDASELPEPTPASSSVSWDNEDEEVGDLEPETEEPIIPVMETPNVDVVEESPEPTPAGSSVSWDDDESDDIADVAEEPEEPMLPVSETPKIEEVGESPNPTPAGSSVSWDDDESDGDGEGSEDELMLPVMETLKFEDDDEMLTPTVVWDDVSEVVEEEVESAFVTESQTPEFDDVDEASELNAGWDEEPDVAVEQVVQEPVISLTVLPDSDEIGETPEFTTGESSVASGDLDGTAEEFSDSIAGRFPLVDGEFVDASDKFDAVGGAELGDEDGNLDDVADSDDVTNATDARDAVDVSIGGDANGDVQESTSFTDNSMSTDEDGMFGNEDSVDVDDDVETNFGFDSLDTSDEDVERTAIDEDIVPGEFAESDDPEVDDTVMEETEPEVEEPADHDSTYPNQQSELGDASFVGDLDTRDDAVYLRSDSDAASLDMDRLSEEDELIDLPVDEEKSEGSTYSESPGVDELIVEVAEEPSAGSDDAAVAEQSPNMNAALTSASGSDDKDGNAGSSISETTLEKASNTDSKEADDTATVVSKSDTTTVSKLKKAKATSNGLRTSLDSSSQGGTIVVSKSNTTTVLQFSASNDLPVSSQGDSGVESGQVSSTVGHEIVSGDVSANTVVQVQSSGTAMSSKSASNGKTPEAVETSRQITFTNDTQTTTYEKYDRDRDAAMLSSADGKQDGALSSGESVANTVIGGRNRDSPVPGADVEVNTTTQHAHDAMRVASYVFTVITTVLLALFLLLSLYGPDWIPLHRTETGSGAWLAPNTWEFVVVVSFFQHLGSISMLELTKAPYMVLDFTDSFSWTNFHFHSLGDTAAAATRRLELVILTGVVSYADRLGIEEGKLLSYTTRFFFVMVVIVALCFFGAVLVHRKLIAQNLGEHKRQHGSMAKSPFAFLEQQRNFAMCGLGFAVALWQLSVFPLSAVSSFELTMQLRYSVTVGMAIAIFNIAGVILGGIAFLFYRVQLVRIKDAMNFHQLAVLGSLYADMKRNARFFFVLFALFQFISGIITGSLTKVPGQLIALLIMNVLFLAAVVIIRPYFDKWALVSVSVLLVLRIINLGLSMTFLTTSSMGTASRGTVANAFVILNFVVLLLIFFRQFLVVVFTVRMWSTYDRKTKPKHGRSSSVRNKPTDALCEADYGNLPHEHHIELYTLQASLQASSGCRPQQVALPPRHSETNGDSPVPNLANRADRQGLHDNQRPQQISLPRTSLRTSEKGDGDSPVPNLGNRPVQPGYHGQQIALPDIPLGNDNDANDDSPVPNFGSLRAKSEFEDIY